MIILKRDVRFQDYYQHKKYNMLNFLFKVIIIIHLFLVDLIRLIGQVELT